MTTNRGAAAISGGAALGRPVLNGLRATAIDHTSHDARAPTRPTSTNRTKPPVHRPPARRPNLKEVPLSSYPIRAAVRPSPQSPRPPEPFAAAGPDRNHLSTHCPTLT